MRLMAAVQYPDPVRVALVQLCPLDGDKARNLAAAGAAVAAAAQAPVVNPVRSAFPESFTVAPPCRITPRAEPRWSERS